MNTTAMAKTKSASSRPAVELSAVETALKLIHQPLLARRIPKLEVPRDILVLIRVLAGEEAAIQNICTQHSVEPADINAAARLYLHCILTNANSNDRRMLCLPKDAEEADIREHKKWLLKWLHPDRNRDSWESVLFLKVNEAFNRLQSSQLAGQSLVSELSQKSVNRHNSKSQRYSKRYHSPYEKRRGENIFKAMAKPLLLITTFVILAGVVLAIAGLEDLHDLFSGFAF